MKYKSGTIQNLEPNLGLLLHPFYIIFSTVPIKFVLL